MAKFNEQMQCEVERVEYDFAKRQGTVWMPWGNWTDMTSCIELFKRIDPKVKEIFTMEGGHMETFYLKFKGGPTLDGWYAYPTPSFAEQEKERAFGAYLDAYFEAATSSVEPFQSHSAAGLEGLPVPKEKQAGEGAEVSGCKFYMLTHTGDPSTTPRKWVKLTGEPLRPE